MARKVWAIQNRCRAGSGFLLSCSLALAYLAWRVKMTDKLMWILSDFRQGKIDLSDTIIKIEILYARQLGLIHISEVAKEFDRLEKKIQKNDKG